MVSPIRVTGFKIHRRKAIPQSFILNFSLLIKKGGFPPFHFLINTRYLGLPPLAPAKPFGKRLERKRPCSLRSTFFEKTDFSALSFFDKHKVFGAAAPCPRQAFWKKA